MSERTNQHKQKERKLTPSKSQTKPDNRGGHSKAAPVQHRVKSKANALRAKKRAAARKARKQRLIALLNRHDQAIKAGKSKIAAKFATALRKEKVGKPELTAMRAVVEDQKKAERAVEKHTVLLKVIAAEQQGEKAAGKAKAQRERAVAEKKHSDAVIQLKRAQRAEQDFFSAMMKLTKNGVCPYCGTERLSIDSHVMDMHPPQWGEYLSLLGRAD